MHCRDTAHRVRMAEGLTAETRRTRRDCRDTAHRVRAAEGFTTETQRRREEEKTGGRTFLSGLVA